MTTSDQPLSRETLDELLSADLDGEFDRAAAELGFTPADARSMLAGTPEAASRRTALAGARDLLATQPALASEQELGLAAAALDRATSAQRPRHRRSERRAFQYGWRALVGAGAAAAVIAGIVALSASNPSSSSKSASLAAPALANGDIHGNARAATVSITFGDVSQRSTLLAKVRAHLSAGQYSQDAPASFGGTGEAPQHGTKGAQGPTGSAGAAGNPGPAGPTGPQGVTGPQGPAGPVGVTGPQGAVGAVGPAGPAGPATVPAPQYATGAQGGTGAAGAVGIGEAAPDGVEGPPDLTPPTATKSVAPGAGTPLLGADGLPEGALQGAQGVLGPADAPSGDRATAAAVTLQSCVVRAEQQSGSGSTSVLSGTGSDGGQRVFVVVLPASGSYVVYVLSAADCAVITRTPLP